MRLVQIRPTYTALRSFGSRVVYWKDGSVADLFDVFLSHTWREGDLEGARRLRNALADLGLNVWFDEANTRSHEGLSPAVAAGLASSRVFVAWFSLDYAQSRPCGWELSAAFLAAQQLDAPQRRMLVVNPEGGKDHIHPVELRDPLYSHLAASSEPQLVTAAAQKIADRAADVDRVFGDARPPGAARWVGATRPSSPRFVGRRTELFRLHTALTASAYPMTVDAPGPAVTQLLGFGGSGKTLLAARYGEQFGAAYPGGVYWAQATRDQTAGQSNEETIRQVLKALAPPAISTDQLQELSIERLRDAVGRALDSEGERFLWIVDDVDPETTLGELQLWTAPGTRGATLLTSLRGIPWARGSNEQYLVLDHLEEQDALRLLLWDHPPVGDRESLAAQRLVAALGCHPLAIDVTRAAICARSQTHSSFLSALASPSRDEIEAAADLVDAGVLPTEHVASIAATILRSTRELSEPGRDVLRLSSVLAQAPIAQDLIASILSLADNLERASGVDHAAKALQTLRSRALATVSSHAAGGDSQWEVHTLVRRLTSRDESHVTRRADLRQAATHCLANRLATVHEETGRAAVDASAEHARHLLSAAGQLDVALALLLAHDHRLGGDHRAAHHLQEQVVEANEQTRGAEDPNTLSAKGTLAVTLELLGDHQGSRDLCEEVLEASQRTLGTEHPTTLGLMGGLATTLKSMGDYQGARDLELQVLEASQRTQGPEHLTSLTAMNNLALTLGLMGDFQSACELEQHVIEASERTLGAEHPDTLTSMGNLASTLNAMGDRQGARDLNEHVLDASERTLGAEHPATLRARHNLARTLESIGDFEASRHLGLQVLDVLQRTLGAEHPYTLTTKGGLASTLWSMGDHVGARELEEQVLEASQRTLGDEHPATLLRMHNLAHTLWSMGDLQGACDLEELALEASQRTLGAAHPTTLTLQQTLERMRAEGSPG